MPPILVGFWVHKFTKQGPFKANFLKHGWVFQKLSKMGSFPPNLIIKVGMTVTVRN